MSTAATTLRSNACRFVLLGGGAVSSELHLPALQALGALERTCVVDPDGDSLARLRQAFPGVQTEQVTSEAFVARNRVQDERSIAIVALPNHLHPAAVEACLRGGYHVLCEKPLALEAETCSRLSTIAEESGRVLGVGMVRRVLPSVRALTAALRQGAVGTLERIEIAHGGPYAWPVASLAPFERRNGGVLADMGVHYLDLLELIFGELTPVAYEDDWRGGVESHCNLRAVTREGIPIELALSRLYELDNRWSVRGSTGQLTLDVGEWQQCTLRPHDPGALVADLRLPVPFAGGPWPPTFRGAFIEQLEAFAAATQDGGGSHATARDAARTATLIEWAYQGRAHGRAHAGQSSADRPALPPAPVVVTGGTGFIGQHLVERLVELGFDRIRVPVRSPGNCAGVARFPVELERVDLLERARVDAVVAGARHVFHLAYGRDGSDAARVTIEGTRNVVEAAIAAGAECVVVLSTMYVFGHPDVETPLDESAPYRPTGGEYGQSKAKMERWCLERAKTAGSTRIVVLNPSCVYGPGGAAYTHLPVQLARDGSFGWIEGGRGVANYTYVDNLIDAILLAANAPAAHGERFLVNDGSCSWRELLEPQLAELAARVPSFTAAELRERPGQQTASVRDLVRHVTNDLELIGVVNRMPIAGLVKRGLFRRIPRVRSALMQVRTSGASGPSAPSTAVAERSYPPAWLADLFGPTRTRFSSEKARRVLGWSPRVELAAGQARTLRWLRSSRILPRAAGAD